MAKRFLFWTRSLCEISDSITSLGSTYYQFPVYDDGESNEFPDTLCSIA